MWIHQNPPRDAHRLTVNSSQSHDIVWFRWTVRVLSSRFLDHKKKKRKKKLDESHSRVRDAHACDLCHSLACRTLRVRCKLINLVARRSFTRYSLARTRFPPVDRHEFNWLVRTRQPVDESRGISSKRKFLWVFLKRYYILLG